MLANDRLLQALSTLLQRRGRSVDVNGHDFEPGAAALREYVKTWPGAGFEFRKQYVVLHCLPLPG